MKGRFANVAYRAGLVGAAISIVYTVNTVWTYETGQPLLSTSRSYVSREEMLVAVRIGIALTLLSWGAGAMARRVLVKRAEKRKNLKQRV